MDAAQRLGARLLANKVTAEQVKSLIIEARAEEQQAKRLQKCARLGRAIEQATHWGDKAEAEIKRLAELILAELTA